jgi:hypothetical protein
LAKGFSKKFETITRFLELLRYTNHCMKLISAISVVLLLPVAGGAAPLNPAQVPSNADWVAHFDVESLLATPLGREVAGLFVPAKRSGAAVEVDWSAALASISSVTVYGLRASEVGRQRDTIVVARSTPAFTRIVEGVLTMHAVLADSTVEEREDFPYSAYSVSGPLRNKAASRESVEETTAWTKLVSSLPTDERDLIVAFPTETLMVAGKSRAAVMRASASLVAPVAAFANESSPLPHMLEAARGAWVFGAILVPAQHAFPEAGVPPKLLALASSGAFACGERGEKVSLGFVVSAPTTNEAKGLLKMSRQIASSLRMMKSKYPDFAEFLQSGDVSAEGREVALQFTQSTPAVTKFLESMPKRFSAKSPSKS